jgi:hypothetical protein
MKDIQPLFTVVIPFAAPTDAEFGNDTLITPSSKEKPRRPFRSGIAFCQIHFAACVAV